MGFAYTGDGLKENLLGVTDKARGKRTRSFMAAWAVAMAQVEEKKYRLEVSADRK